MGYHSYRNLVVISIFLDIKGNSGRLFNSGQPCYLSDSSLVDGLLQVRFCSSKCAQSDILTGEEALKITRLSRDTYNYFIQHVLGVQGCVLMGD